MNSDVIAVSVDGVVNYHMESIDGQEETMCGLDGGLSSDCNQKVLCIINSNIKIDCVRCKLIFDTVSRYKKNQFIYDKCAGTDECFYYVED